jgi:hypothetical protein
MKKIFTLLVAISIMGLTTLSAQQNNPSDKAADRFMENIGTAVELSEDQVEKIYAIYADAYSEFEKTGEANTDDKDALKKALQETFKAAKKDVISNVLDADQQQAVLEALKAMKATKADDQ